MVDGEAITSQKSEQRVDLKLYINTYELFLHVKQYINLASCIILVVVVFLVDVVVVFFFLSFFSFFFLLLL